jgi:aspartate kinase
MSTVKAGGIIQTVGLARVGVMSVPDRPGIASAVLSALGHEGVNVHFIVQSVDVNNRSHIILCVSEEELDLALSIIDRVRPAVGWEQVIWQKSTAMVSLFGPHFRDYPGVAGMAFSALASAGINIWSISTSISTISCIIDGERLAEAVEALKKVFEVAPSAVFTAACGLSLRSTVGSP